jgi:hypothetical protein
VHGKIVMRAAPQLGFRLVAFGANRRADESGREFFVLVCVAMAGDEKNHD